MPPRKSTKKSQTRSSHASETSTQESEFREAFQLFSTKPKTREKRYLNNDGEAYLPLTDFRRALSALNFPLPDTKSREWREILSAVNPDEDEEDQRKGIDFETFVGVAELLARRQDDGAADAENEEIESVYHMFTKNRPGAKGISLQDLKHVVGLLKLEDQVDEALLRDMIREAKGGEEGEVSLDEFGDVVRRAGAVG
ncbi:hypothetical protein K470DRAFT_258332 [Piedraia hortae CBS 480.64]|uniref:EF-hand n=1 Tax=Piedraia hortae CBS 480.64 TaxID=1314780 RepID=A0A6A7BX93_9PEZI|nr:hypothetical protein K470DRAFT_258332 [Piedraia hortae CBS 480.64]